MFKPYRISVSEAGSYNPLVTDYIEGKSQLKDFYDLSPAKQSITDLANSDGFKNLNRNELTALLSRQATSVDNTSESTKKNIELLKNNKTFTVTTGHQLCLFTGPLYFIYKIFSVINICDKLNTENKDLRFVPVYWAASEDHDFEEVNHFNAFGKKIQWESLQSGAVGSFSTRELEKYRSDVQQLFGSSEHSEYLISLFERSYLRHDNLADATRYLVNELFGRYGIVVVDGNDAAFKKQFQNYFRQDIFENRPFQKVSKSIDRLKQLGYTAQVNPRMINCFYMEKGIRGRIEKTDNQFSVVGTEKKFNEQELQSLIDSAPEKISPNVVLRPLYQQCILPNVAYVGGPGELAYWLEYKEMFADAELVFPVLLPRASFTIVENNVRTKTEKLGLSYLDLFNSEHDLIKNYLSANDSLFDVQDDQKNISAIYESLAERIEKIDPTLSASSKAELQKVLNGLEGLKAKVNKALKQKSDTQINQLKGIKEKLFPGGTPQERHDNFSMFFLKWGEEFFNTLKEHIQPFEVSHTVLIEQE